MVGQYNHQNQKTILLSKPNSKTIYENQTQKQTQNPQNQIQRKKPKNTKIDLEKIGSSPGLLNVVDHNVEI